MSFPKYNQYIRSAVKWLGCIPSHWEIYPLKAIAAGSDCLFIDGDWIESRNLSDNGIRYITTGNVGSGFYKEQGSGYISEETFVELGCTEVQPGDVLISRLNAPIGRACIVPNLGIRVVTSVDNVICRPAKKFDKKFLVFRLSSPDYLHEAGTIASGATMQRISRSELGNIRIAFPPLDEQTAIAHFLDHETAKIDALIAEQEKLIHLLAEKRQATISHAVTRGLDPAAPMKDSGVAWLGEVPAHWDVTRLKYVTDAVVDCPHETPNYNDDGEYRVIRTADVSQGRLHMDAMYSVTEEEFLRRIRRMSLNQGDIVYGREGERWGFAAQVPEDDMYCLGQRMMQFRVSDGMQSRFLMWQLNALNTYRQGEMDTVGATSPHVNVGTIKNYALTEPPFGEQEEISKFIDTETTRLDTLRAEAERAIVLLKERRAALIAAAVTGQIDVRGAVAA